MKRRYAIALGIALGVVGSVAGFATVARTAPADGRQGVLIGPRMPSDSGAGELLLAVTGGIFPTKAEAEAANAALGFGDLQGYYVVPVGQFKGLDEQVDVQAGYALMSVFRTEEGAQEFLELARTLGVPATLVPERVQSYGGTYAGLGQEADPRGTGPLLGPVPASLPGADPVP